MKTEKVLLIVLILSIILRYLWAAFGWGTEIIALFPPIFSVMLLLIYYFLEIHNPYYKASILYFIIFIISIVFNIMEWPGRGLLLFLGSLGFILFPVYFFFKQKERIHSPLFKYSLLLSTVLIAQTVLYIFVPTNKILTVAHMFSYLIIIIASYCVFSKDMEQEINIDEKKILTFIIIANALSLLGVTFKESFYYLIWI